MTEPSPHAQPRDGEEQPVTSVELFFDLIYVFAVTQLPTWLSMTSSARRRSWPAGSRRSPCPPLSLAALEQLRRAPFAADRLREPPPTAEHQPKALATLNRISSDVAPVPEATMFPADEALLDNPVYAALSGPHARFAQASGHALRYPADVAPFLGLPSEPAEQDWRSAADLVPPGTQAAIIATATPIPKTWSTTRSFEVVQLTGEHVSGIYEPEAVSLGPRHVSEMLELARETNPGPFLNRTVELGEYIGIRRDDRLIAMAGERLHLDGWTEISAVCTASTHRRHGLASRLVNALIAGIERRSERAFLHVLATNTSAIHLYEALGFRPRRRLTITAMSAPSH